MRVKSESFFPELKVLFLSKSKRSFFDTTVPIFKNSGANVGPETMSIYGLYFVRGDEKRPEIKGKPN